MKLKLLVMLIVAFLSCCLSSSAQTSSDSCLRLVLPHLPDSLIYNPDSVMVDTCGVVFFIPGERVTGYMYAKQFFSVDFKHNILPTPLAPEDTIIELQWQTIDSITYGVTREGFRQLEQRFGSFVFREPKPHEPDTTQFLPRVLYIRFENYVNIDSVEKYLLTIPLVKKRWYMNRWLDGRFLSVSSQYKNISIKLYPNPASENITITFPTDFSFKTVVKLCDITGREILLKEIPSDENNYTFSLKEFPVGVYVLEVHSGSEVFTKQVSVIR